MPTEKRIRIPVPHARGGASRQPAHLRHANQAEEVQNADVSVVDGTSKRPGSLYVDAVAGLDASGNYRFHTIERDGTERYLVAFGDVSGTMTLKAWDVDAAYDVLAANPPTDAAAQTYLDNGSPTADDSRMTTQGDTTIIVNTKVATGVTSSPDYQVRANRTSFDILTSFTLNTPGEHGAVRPTGDDPDARTK